MYHPDVTCFAVEFRTQQASAYTLHTTPTNSGEVPGYKPINLHCQHLHNLHTIKAALIVSDTVTLATGLKYGMYSDAGSKTCLGLPGSRGNEELDAQYFADLGVDFLKYDNCYAGPEDWIVDRYVAMRDALNNTGRPILYSMCNWGVGDSWLWGPKVALHCC